VKRSGAEKTVKSDLKPYRLNFTGLCESDSMSPLLRVFGNVIPRSHMNAVKNTDNNKPMKIEVQTS